MTHETKRILLAEDDTFLTEILASTLQAHGVDVAIAHDGQKAIDSMDRSPPDLLLLDLLMPHVDGFAVLRHRQEKRYTFPVLVLSNLGDKIAREKCDALGISDYLVKSDMDDSQLWPIVETYLRQS